MAISQFSDVTGASSDSIAQAVSQDQETYRYHGIQQDTQTGLLDNQTPFENTKLTEKLNTWIGQSVLLSPEDKEACRRFLDSGCWADMSARDVRAIQTMLGQLLVPGAQTALALSLQDIRQIQAVSDAMDLRHEPDVAFAAGLRDEMLSDYGISPQEQQFRNSVHLIDPQADGVRVLADELLRTGQLGTKSSLREIAEKSLSLVQNRFQYIKESTDPDGTTQDRWQSVSETMTKGGGDCEDLAILQASLLINLMEQLGYSQSAIRERVHVSAGYMHDALGNMKGHAVVRLQMDDGDLALDPTGKGAPQRFDSLNFDVVFEANDWHFNVYQPIDPMFVTAMDVTGLNNPDSIVGRINTVVEELEKKLQTRIEIPLPKSTSGGDLARFFGVGSQDVMQKRNASGVLEDITKTEDFAFFKLNYSTFSPPNENNWMYLAEIKESFFLDYVNSTRNLTNQLVMLFHIGNSYLDFIANEAAEIGTLGMDEQTKADYQEWQSSDSFKGKTIGAINNYLQKSNNYIQKVADEVFRFVESNNSAQSQMAQYKIDNWARESLFTALPTALIDEFTNAFNMTRIVQKVAVVERAAQTSANNTLSYLNYARGMTESVALWAEGTSTAAVVDPTSPVGFGMTTHTVLSGTGSGGVNKSAYLGYLDRAKAQVTQIKGAMGTSPSFSSSYGLAPADMNQGMLQGQLFGAHGDTNQFVQANMDQMAKVLFHNAMFQNFVGVSLLIQQTLEEAQREVAARLSGKKSSSSTQQVKQAALMSLGAELGKQGSALGSVQNATVGLSNMATTLMQQRINYQKQIETTGYKVMKLVLQVVGTVIGTVLGNTVGRVTGTAMGAASAAMLGPFGIPFLIPVTAIYQEAWADYFSRNTTNTISAAVELLYTGLMYSMELRSPEAGTSKFIQEGNTFGRSLGGASLSGGALAAANQPNKTIWSDGERAYLKNMSNAKVLGARDNYNVRKNESVTTNIFGATASGTRNRERTEFIANRGDGQVVSNGFLMASREDLTAMLQGEVYALVGIYKAQRDAIENIMTQMFGVQKANMATAMGQQISQSVGLEQQLVAIYKMDSNMRMASMNMMLQEDKRLNSQIKELSLAAAKIGFAAAQWINTPILLPAPAAIGAVLPLYLGIQSAISLGEKVVDTADLLYKYEWGPYSANAADYHERSLNTEESTFLKDLTGAASKMQAIPAGPMSRYTKLDLLEKTQLARLTDYGGGHGNWGGNLVTGKDGTILTYANELIEGAGDLPFRQVNYAVVSDVYKEIANITALRIFHAMIEQALYQQKQNVLRNMFGVSSAAGPIDTMMQLMDTHNSAILNGAFESFLDEARSRVESSNAFQENKISKIIDGTLLALTTTLGIAIIAQYANAAYGNTGKAGAEGNVKRLQQAQSVVRIVGATVRVVFGLMLMYSVRGSSPIIESSMATYSDPEEKDGKTEEERKAARAKNAPSEQGITRGGGAQKRVSAAERNRQQTLARRRERQITLMREISLALASATADAAEGVSGVGSSKSWTSITRIINTFAQVDVKQADFAYMALKDQAAAYNRGVAKVVEGATVIVGEAISKISARMEESAKKKETEAKAVRGQTAQSSGSNQALTREAVALERSAAAMRMFVRLEGMFNSAVTQTIIETMLWIMGSIEDRATFVPFSSEESGTDAKVEGDSAAKDGTSSGKGGPVVAGTADLENSVLGISLMQANIALLQEIQNDRIQQASAMVVSLRDTIKKGMSSSVANPLKARLLKKEEEQNNEKLDKLAGLDAESFREAYNAFQQENEAGYEALKASRPDLTEQGGYGVSAYQGAGAAFDKKDSAFRSLFRTDNKKEAEKAFAQGRDKTEANLGFQLSPELRMAFQVMQQQMGGLNQAGQPRSAAEAWQVLQKNRADKAQKDIRESAGTRTMAEVKTAEVAADRRASARTQEMALLELRESYELRVGTAGAGAGSGSGSRQNSRDPKVEEALDDLERSLRNETHRGQVTRRDLELFRDSTGQRLDETQINDLLGVRSRDEERGDFALSLANVQENLKSQGSGPVSYNELGKFLHDRDDGKNDLGVITAGIVASQERREIGRVVAGVLTLGLSEAGVRAFDKVSGDSLRKYVDSTGGLTKDFYALPVEKRETLLREAGLGQAEINQLMGDNREKQDSRFEEIDAKFAAVKSAIQKAGIAEQAVVQQLADATAGRTAIAGTMITGVFGVPIETTATGEKIQRVVRNGQEEKVLGDLSVEDRKTLVPIVLVPTPSASLAAAAASGVATGVTGQPVVVYVDAATLRKVDLNDPTIAASLAPDLVGNGLQVDQESQDLAAKYLDADDVVQSLETQRDARALRVQVALAKIDSVSTDRKVESLGLELNARLQGANISDLGDVPSALRDALLRNGLIDAYGMVMDRAKDMAQKPLPPTQGGGNQLRAAINAILTNLGGTGSGLPTVAELEYVLSGRSNIEAIDEIKKELSGVIKDDGAADRRKKRDEIEASFATAKDLQMLPPAQLALLKARGYVDDNGELVRAKVMELEANPLAADELVDQIALQAGGDAATLKGLLLKGQAERKKMRAQLDVLDRAELKAMGMNVELSDGVRQMLAERDKATDSARLRKILTDQATVFRNQALTVAEAEALNPETRNAFVWGMAAVGAFFMWGLSLGGSGYQRLSADRTREEAAEKSLKAAKEAEERGIDRFAAAQAFSEIVDDLSGVDVQSREAKTFVGDFTQAFAAAVGSRDAGDDHAGVKLNALQALVVERNVVVRLQELIRENKEKEAAAIFAYILGSGKSGEQLAEGVLRRMVMTDGADPVALLSAVASRGSQDQLSALARTLSMATKADTRFDLLIDESNFGREGISDRELGRLFGHTGMHTQEDYATRKTKYGSGVAKASAKTAYAADKLRDLIGNSLDKAWMAQLLAGASPDAVRTFVSDLDPFDADDLLKQLAQTSGLSSGLQPSGVADLVKAYGYDYSPQWMQDLADKRKGASPQELQNQYDLLAALAVYAQGSGNMALGQDVQAALQTVVPMIPGAGMPALPPVTVVPPTTIETNIAQRDKDFETFRNLLMGFQAPAQQSPLALDENFARIQDAMKALQTGGPNAVQSAIAALQAATPTSAVWTAVSSTDLREASAQLAVAVSRKLRDESMADATNIAGARADELNPAQTPGGPDPDQLVLLDREAMGLRGSEQKMEAGFANLIGRLDPVLARQIASRSQDARQALRNVATAMATAPNLGAVSAGAQTIVGTYAAESDPVTSALVASIQNTVSVANQAEFSETAIESNYFKKIEAALQTPGYAKGEVMDNTVIALSEIYEKLRTKPAEAGAELDKIKDRVVQVVRDAVARGHKEDVLRVLGELNRAGMGDVLTDLGVLLSASGQSTGVLDLLRAEDQRLSGLGRVLSDEEKNRLLGVKTVIAGTLDTTSRVADQLLFEQIATQQKREALADVVQRFVAGDVGLIKAVIEDSTLRSDLALMVAQGMALDITAAYKLMAVLAERAPEEAKLLADAVGARLLSVNADIQTASRRVTLQEVREKLEAQVEAGKSTKEVAAVATQIDNAYGMTLYVPASLLTMSSQSRTDWVNDRIQKGRIDEVQEVFRALAFRDPESGAKLLTDVHRLNPNLAMIMYDKLGKEIPGANSRTLDQLQRLVTTALPELYAQSLGQRNDLIDTMQRDFSLIHQAKNEAVQPKSLGALSAMFDKEVAVAGDGTMTLKTPAQADIAVQQSAGKLRQLLDPRPGSAADAVVTQFGNHPDQLTSADMNMLLMGANGLPKHEARAVRLQLGMAALLSSVPSWSDPTGKTGSWQTQLLADRIVYEGKDFFSKLDNGTSPGTTNQQLAAVQTILTSALPGEQKLDVLVTVAGIDANVLKDPAVAGAVEGFLRAAPPANRDVQTLLSPTGPLGLADTSTTAAQTAIDDFKNTTNTALLQNFLNNPIQMHALKTLHPEAYLGLLLTANTATIPGGTGSDLAAVSAYAPQIAAFQGPVTAGVLQNVDQNLVGPFMAGNPQAAAALALLVRADAAAGQGKLAHVLSRSVSVDRGALAASLHSLAADLAQTGGASSRDLTSLMSAVRTLREKNSGINTTLQRLANQAAAKDAQGQSYDTELNAIRAHIRLQRASFAEALQTTESIPLDDAEKKLDQLLQEPGLGGVLVLLDSYEKALQKP